MQRSPSQERGIVDFRGHITFGNGGPQSRMFSRMFNLNTSVTNKLFLRYWQFLLYLFITLTAFELILSPMPGLYSVYSNFIGYMGLAIEATLPLPQIYSNYKSRSCAGFRPSILINWLLGDAMKMFYFATTDTPWPFKLCGIFQACCDSYIGLQYFFLYGEGDAGMMVKGHGEHGISLNGFANGSHGPRARTPMGEKDVRLGD